MTQEKEKSGLETTNVDATTIWTVAFGDSVAMTASDVAWQAHTHNTCCGDDVS